MIALAVLVTFAQNSAIAIVSQPIAGAPVVSVQAVLKMPETGERSYAAAKVLESVLLRETEDYSQNQIRDWGGQAGQPPLVVVQPSRLLIRLTFPANQGRNAVALMDSILRRPILSAGATQSAIAKGAVPSSDLLLINEMPWSVSMRRVTERDVTSLWKATAQPGNITVAIGGAVTPDLIQYAHERLDTWEAARPFRTQTPPKQNPITPLLRHAGSLHAFQWEGPLVSAQSERVTPALLASIALGVGKSSSWFQVVREELGLTYIAYGGFSPESSGVRIRLFGFHSGEWNPEKSAPIAVSMRKNVESWNQRTIDRAIGMARACLSFDYGPNAAVLGLGSQHVGDIADQTLLAAIWRSEMGTTWDAHAILSRMSHVTLAELQAEARRTIDEGTIRVVLASAEPTQKPVP